MGYRHQRWSLPEICLRPQWFFYLPPVIKYRSIAILRSQPSQVKILPFAVRNKGSIFSSVILRPWVLVWPGFEPATSCTKDRHSTNWANWAAVYVIAYHVIIWTNYRVLILDPEENKNPFLSSPGPHPTSNEQSLWQCQPRNAHFKFARCQRLWFYSSVIPQLP